MFYSFLSLLVVFFFLFVLLFVDQRSGFFFSLLSRTREDFTLTKRLSSLIPLQTQQGRKFGGFEIGALGCDSFVAIQR